MAKYNVIIAFQPIHVEFDTADHDDFAKTKDDLPDLLDPNEHDAVYDYVYELAENGEWAPEDLLLKVERVVEKGDE